MGKGRGSARPCLAVVVSMIWLLAMSEEALGAIYTVGGTKGWTFKVNTWPKGKIFRAGDVLVFKYGKSAHNVVTVNSKGYKTCMKTRGSRVYQSGKDILRLKKGHNFFICSFPGHCQSGMKIDVYAF